MNPKDPSTWRMLDEAAMESFVHGNEGLRPQPHHNLQRQREIAKERIERYMRWIMMCDELLSKGIQQLCVPPDYDTIAIAVVRAYPSSNLDHQMVLAMRQSKGTASPSVMRAALEHHRTASAQSDAVQVRARDMLNEQGDGLGYIIPKPEK